MFDLDILVPVPQQAQAHAALALLGYVAQESGNGAGHLEPAMHHGTPLVSREQLLAVELHHHVTIPGEGDPFDIADFWDRSRPSAQPGCLLPSPEDLLLHVCLHFTRNRLGGNYFNRYSGGALAQLCDVARLIEYEAIHRTTTSTRPVAIGCRPAFSWVCSRHGRSGSRYLAMLW